MEESNYWQRLRQSRVSRRYILGAGTTTALGAAAGLIVRKGIPRRPVGAVVFAHGAPLPFREIGAPALPVYLSVPVLLQSEFFFGRNVSPTYGG